MAWLNTGDVHNAKSRDFKKRIGVAIEIIHLTGYFYRKTFTKGETCQCTNAAFTA